MTAWPSPLGRTMAAAVLAAVVGVSSAGVVDGSATVAGSVWLNPLTVALSVPASGQAGQPVKVTASIANVGRRQVAGIAVSLRADPLALRVKPATVSTVQVKPGRVATVTWSVCASTAGSFVLLVHVESSGGSIDSPAQVLSIRPGRKARCP